MPSAAEKLKTTTNNINTTKDIMVCILKFMDPLLTAKMACINTIWKAAVEESWKYHAHAQPEDIKKISINPYRFSVILSHANRRAEEKRKQLELSVRFIKHMSQFRNNIYRMDYELLHFTGITEKSQTYFAALYQNLFPISSYRLEPDFVHASFENTYLFKALEQQTIDINTQHLLNNLFQLNRITEHKDNYSCAFKFLFSNQEYLDYILTNINEYQHVHENQYGDELIDQNTLTLCIHFFARINLALLTLDDVKNLITNMKNKDIDKLNDFIPEHLKTVEVAARNSCVLS